MNGSNDQFQIDPKVAEYVDRRVSEQFRNQWDFVRSTIGTALKVLGLAISLVAGVAIFFGWRDAERIANALISQRLDSINPVASYQKRVDDLYVHALIDSYLLKLTLISQTPSYRRNFVYLEDDEAERIVELLKNRKTDQKMFSDAVRILTDATKTQSRNQLYVVLTEMLTADESYKWMDKEPAKRSTIIDNLARKRQTQASPIVRRLLTDRPEDKKLLLSCIEFASSAEDRNAVKALESIAAEKEFDDPVKHSLFALARIKPDSQVLSQRLNDLLKKGAKQQDRVLIALEIAKNLVSNPECERSPFTADTGERAIDHSLVPRILQAAVDIRIDRYLTEEFVDPSHIDMINSLVFGEEDCETGTGSEPLKEILKNALLNRDHSRFIKILQTFIGSGDEQIGDLYITLSEGGSVTVDGNIALDRKTKELKIEFLATPKSTLLAVWKDTAGNITTSQIISFNHPEKIDFTLKPKVTEADGEE